MKNFRQLSEEVTPSSKPEAGREAVGGRFTSSSPKKPIKPVPHVTAEETISEIIMPQVKGDLDSLDRTSFVKKHGVSKSMAKQRLATEAKEKTEYDYEGDMARGQLQSIISNAQRVHDMLEDDTNIAEWVQSKITLAEDYISTVANYMMSELDESKDVGDIPSGDVNSPNLSVKKGKTVASGPVTEATSAAVRMQRALDKIKQSREASERRAQELLKPKPKNEEVELDEVSTDGYHKAAVKSRMDSAVKVMSSMGKDKEATTKLDARNAGLKRLSDRTSAEMKKANSGPQKTTPSKSPTEAERRGYGQGRYMGDSVEVDDEVVVEMDNRTPSSDREEQRNNSPERLAKKDKEQQKRLRDTSPEMRKKLHLPEPKESVMEAQSAAVRWQKILEARPSQRHPLEGHEYHKKSDEALVHIAKDAHAAAEAMKSHNTTAENKYRDQANDSATVRHFRKTSGMPDWYKKKYGHMKEAFRPMDEPNYNNSIEARQKKADANKPPFDGPYKKSTGVVTDKSGAKHGPMSIARNLAKQALKKQASKMSVKEGLEESRKAEIVKEIMKKGKKKEDNTFQGEPELGTTVVKADN